MRSISIFLIMTVIAGAWSNHETRGQPSLIPIPKFVDWEQGNLPLQNFSDDQDLQKQIQLVKGEIENPYGLAGAYELVIKNKIQIQAQDSAGFFYGLQTLKQLIRSDAQGSCFVPKCHIKDWPSFEIRGFMHDVGRNYQSMTQLKEQIDIMAFYKYNVFHMHLTDNPGWRLESKLYPELQDPTATSRKPGKFYTQQEFIELFEYCEERHITIIPELDVPGHTEAFRRALKIKSMNSPEVQQIIIDLVDELCGLIPADRMPYIHLGTDEVRKGAETVDDDFLVPIIRRIEENGRRYVSWWHGIKTPGDSLSIKQLWAQTEALEGHPMIDSRSNYVNHLDPLAGMYRLYSQQPCRVPNGDSIHMGGILCCWPDNLIEDERNILKQNPVYPAMVFYSDAIWNGKEDDDYEHWAIMPDGEGFQNLEDKVIEHRDQYFDGKPFPYVKHTHIPWKIIGPFDHQGDVGKIFQVEDKIQETYVVNGEEFTWWDETIFGGTVHLRHFFGFPAYLDEKKGTVYATTQVWSPKEQEVGFWIGFHNWSRSGGRRGGPTPEQGEWHHTQPKIWVNHKEIAPPVWENPGLAVKTPETPFTNEDYYYRDPSPVSLNKGWNRIVLKIPVKPDSFKWMFTCVPVQWDGINVKEYDGGLEWKAELK